MARVFSLLFLMLGLGIANPAKAEWLYEGQAFYGGWAIPNIYRGEMVVGNGMGLGLSVGGTDRFCGTPGAAYSTMARYIDSNYPMPVSWFVDEICNDGYVRICVYSNRGAMACSTYVYYGIVPFY